MFIVDLTIFQSTPSLLKYHLLLKACLISDNIGNKMFVKCKKENSNFTLGPIKKNISHLV